VGGHKTLPTPKTAQRNVWVGRGVSNFDGELGNFPLPFDEGEARWGRGEKWDG